MTGTHSVTPLRGPRRLRPGLRPRAGRLLPRRADRPQGDHRDLLHRPRPGPRRHPLLPLRLRAGRPRRRAQPLPRDGLQGRARRPRPRRRQGRHHRRPGHAQDRGAAARLRPLRAVARRPLLHRLRRRHVQRGHGPHRPRVLLRHRPHRRARRRRRLLGAHGVRRLPGHARRGRARPGARPTLHGRTVGVAGVGKVGRHLVRHLVEDGADGRRHRRRPRPPSPRVQAEHPGVTRVADTDALVAAELDVYAPVRARRRAHRRGGRRRCAPGSSAAPPTTSSPTTASRSSCRTAACSTPPTTWSTPAA